MEAAVAPPAGDGEPAGRAATYEAVMASWAECAAALIPPTLTPYRYQLECLEQVAAQNTIVNMPTGTGKTLVAALAAGYYITRVEPAKKVLFVVKDLPLVDQQAAAIERALCREGEAPVRCLKVSGELTRGWTDQDWKRKIDAHQVVVGIAAVVLQGLERVQTIQLHDVSLVVFDECHNAVGKSDMARICHWIHRHSEGRPDGAPMWRGRVLGLTASWELAKVERSTLQQHREALEKVLQSNLYVPPSLPDNAWQKAAAQVHRIEYSKTIFETHVEVVHDTVTTHLFKPLEAMFAPLGFGAESLRREAVRVKNSWVKVLQELGMDACALYLEKALVRSLEEKVQTVSDWIRVSQVSEVKLYEYRCAQGDVTLTEGDYVAEVKRRLREAAQDVLPRFNTGVVVPFMAALRQLQRGGYALPAAAAEFYVQAARPDGAAPQGEVQRIPPESHKFALLRQLLCRLLKEAYAGRRDYAYKGIVFVREVALAAPLQMKLQQCFNAALEPQLCQLANETGSAPPILKVDVHHGRLPRDEQVRVEESFKAGKTQVLVSTATTEEGFDDKDCAFIVRFSEVSVTKSFVQGNGRARRGDAQLFYFEDDPAEHVIKERQMMESAQNACLNCPRHILRDAALATTATEQDGVFPYRRLTLQSAVSVVNLYVQALLRRSGHRILFEETPVPCLRVPLPQGWITLNQRDVDAHFGDGGVAKYVPAELRPKTAKELRRKALYFVGAVRLMRDGLVGDDHKPTTYALISRTRDNCPLPAEADGDTWLTKLRPVCDADYQAVEETEPGGSPGDASPRHDPDDAAGPPPQQPAAADLQQCQSYDHGNRSAPNETPTPESQPPPQSASLPEWQPPPPPAPQPQLPPPCSFAETVPHAPPPAPPPQSASLPEWQPPPPPAPQPQLPPPCSFAEAVPHAPPSGGGVPPPPQPLCTYTEPPPLPYTEQYAPPPLWEQSSLQGDAGYVPPQGAAAPAPPVPDAGPWHYGPGYSDVQPPYAAAAPPPPPCDYVCLLNEMARGNNYPTYGYHQTAAGWAAVCHFQGATVYGPSAAKRKEAKQYAARLWYTQSVEAPAPPVD
eukprot:TRINITY_DN4167_c0_g1_i5.p1 TRINITY_DN4167_c0_g1~~TRINITY_DN4167_c0_g1_i5.p1  ORF type:complete len:1076 (+),score=368.29 TRINITY_DN4167_c0_g1_i5:76-3303(+)